LIFYIKEISLSSLFLFMGHVVELVHIIGVFLSQSNTLGIPLYCMAQISPYIITWDICVQHFVLWNTLCWRWSL